MSRRKGSLLRPTLAALIGSSLSTSQLKELAMLIESDPEFRHALGRSLYETSQSLSVKAGFELDIDEPIEDVAEDSALVEIALGIVNRKRLTKHRIYDIIYSVYPPAAKKINEKDSARQILSKFFMSATTAARQEFLKELGVEVAVDPYLGGISRRF